MRGWATIFAVLALLAGACGDSDSGEDATTGVDDATTTAPSDDGEDGTDGGTDGAGSDDPGSEDVEPTATDTGVTATDVEVGVVVSNLDGLIDAGVDLPASLTTENLEKRISAYIDDWNADGGFHGRDITYVPLYTDPIDPTSLEDACNVGILDEEVFMVLLPAGTFLPLCVTQDGDTLYIQGEQLPLETFEAAGDLLLTLLPPGDIMAEQGTKLLVDEDMIPADATVAILASDTSIGRAYFDRAAGVLETAGVTVVNGEYSPVDGDSQATNQELRQLVPELMDQGVDFVIPLVTFVNSRAFFEEAEALDAGWDYAMVDVSTGMCTNFSASRLPGYLDGTPCATPSTPGIGIDGQIPPDNEVEADCREAHDRHYGIVSQPGVPSGGLTAPDGTELAEDFPQFECNLTYLLPQALELAGVDLTHESLYAAFLSITEGGAANISGGTGGFGPDKPWWANQITIGTLIQVDEDNVTLGDDGLWGGCPSPRSCFRQIVDWVPLET